MKTSVRLFFVILGLVVSGGLLGEEDGLLKSIAANKDVSGGMVIEGKIALPADTKLMFTLHKPGSKAILAQSETTINAEGGFSTEGFTNGSKPWPDGKYDIEIIAHFTQMFGQPASVIEIVGDNGNKLEPSKDLKPDDAEFPNAGKHLQVIRQVIVSTKKAVGKEAAIQAVNNATLDVKGKGRSADTIAGCINYFKSGGGFEPKGWDATQKGLVWTVTLSYVDGSNPQKASWSFNEKTKEVHYLDPNSKLLSWTAAQ